MTQPIASPEDWITQTKNAKDVLIAKHGFEEKHFHTLGPDDDPTLSWCDRYPAEWGHLIRRNEQGRLICGYVKESCFPVGLVLLWEDGTDYWGEAHDPADPIFMLEDIEAHT